MHEDMFSSECEIIEICHEIEKCALRHGTRVHHFPKPASRPYDIPNANELQQKNFQRIEKKQRMRGALSVVFFNQLEKSLR